MPVLNRIADIAPEITAWRRDLHQHPELLYDLPRTSALVADKLRSFGLDAVITGLGRTGVVGVLHGRSGPGGRAIALRADMDALPVTEETGAPWASRNPGLMHACGHDGHTAMLLGAARHLAESRAFEGTVIFVFQPAEEGGGGAKAMIDDGLFETVRIDEVYGLHTMPGIPVGHFATRTGPIMASADRLRIDIEGRGGHAAIPHETIDPILVGSHIIQGLQTIVSRTVSPLKAAVVSITRFQAGTTDNVIPQTATLAGTMRSLDADVRPLVQERIGTIVGAIAEAFGARATVTIAPGYPVTVNDPVAARFAADVARRVAGPAAVAEDVAPLMAAEDFSYYLERKPGAFVFIGNGDSAGLHHAAFDFNDDAIAYGTSWWSALVEAALSR